MKQTIIVCWIFVEFGDVRGNVELGRGSEALFLGPVIVGLGVVFFSAGYYLASSGVPNVLKDFFACLDLIGV